MIARRRTESEAVRTEQILEAARKVFCQKGYDAATVSDIVREAGIAQGTFYLYFESKKDAFLALSRQFQQMMAKAAERAHDPEAPFEERIRSWIEASFDCARHNTDLARLIHFGADSLAPEVRRSFGKDNPVVAFRAQMLRQAVEAGEMQPMDPEMTARLIHGMLKDALMQAFVVGDGDDADRIRGAITKLLVNALRPGE